MDRKSDKINSATEDSIKKKRVRKNPLIFYSIIIIFPFLFFLIFEITLRMTGYGYDFETFIPASEANPELLKLNPELTFKYFNNLNLPLNFIPDVFTKEKDINTFRVFVFGGSSTAGWPFSANEAFARNIKRFLNEDFPKKNIEVVNFGISAVNSFTIRDIAFDAAEFDPDLVIIYAGHNEYYGTLGAASSGNSGGNRTLINLMLIFKKFRVFQFLQNMINNIGSSFYDNPDTGHTVMARMIGNSSIELNSDLYFQGVHQFKENMSDVINRLKQNGTTVILTTITSNIAMPPFAANSISDKKALQLFDEGKLLVNSGIIEQGKEKLINARDYDQVRFRAPSDINKTMLNLEKEFKVDVVDIDSIFNQHFETNLFSNSLFVDHLHPTVEGHRIIALHIYNAMKRLEYLPDAKGFEVCNDSLKLLLINKYKPSLLDSTLAEINLKVLMNDYPFVPLNESKNFLESFKPMGIYDSLALEIVLMKKTELQIRKLLLDKLIAKGRVDEFKREINSLIEKEPYKEMFYLEAISALKSANRFDDVVNYARQYYSVKPTELNCEILGISAFENNNFEAAIIFFTNGLSLNNKNAAAYMYLSICNYYTGKKNKAYELFENGYSINPKISRVRIIGYLQSKKFNFALPMLEFETQKNADAFNTKWLGQLYLMSKRYEDAVIFLNKSASINPNDPQTFFNLAGSHFYNNNKDEALTVINKCLSLSPNFPKADEWKRKIQK
ncbi:MAG: hypothetical protein KJ799_16260 [Bacteroidetes bacterium]|nr:hypothetical protein [Bacteroidota bacterium]